MNSAVPTRRHFLRTAAAALVLPALSRSAEATAPNLGFSLYA